MSLSLLASPETGSLLRFTIRSDTSFHFLISAEKTGLKDTIKISLKPAFSTPKKGRKYFIRKFSKCKKYTLGLI